MAWRRIGDKPLSEPMLTQFTDTYVALGGDELTFNDTAHWGRNKNGGHLVDDILKCVSLNEKFYILFKFHWGLFQ